MRKKFDFDENWIFLKPDCEAVQVRLPHTWNAVDGTDGGNDYYRGACTYMKTFLAPPHTADEEIWLEFAGVAMSARVSLNDQLLGCHEGGYSTFRVNLTPALAEGENRLTVIVDNGANRTVYPQKADFTFYGGIYRDVTMIIVPKMHLALNHHGAPALNVTPVVAENLQSARVTLCVLCENAADGAEVTLEICGVDKKQAIVKDGSAQAVFEIEHVHLWDGRKDPFLYTARATLENGDCESVRFGCRTFKVDGQNGFYLNGHPYRLCGVARHQDRQGMGNAITGAEHKEDMEIICEMGANTIRLAHYQHSQYFYDLCDEYGMIVWAEIPYITEHMPEGRANTLSQMEELVLQNYNHPSIICWGLSNEITAATGVTEDMVENHKLLNDLCHRLDPYRLTTMAHAFMLDDDDPFVFASDIRSYNLYYGWYIGEKEQNDQWFDDFHRKYPQAVIGLSEYGADANPAYQSACPDKGDWTESYQAVYHEHMLEMWQERPYIWAMHVWNGFDFAADGRDEGGKPGQNQKGLVTFDRRLKKDAYYIYKAYLSDDPFVHLCGRRYADRAESRTEIKVYSNQAEVTLYMDGQFVETLVSDKVFQFYVDICGEHLIEAKAGNCTDSMTVHKVAQANPAYRVAGGGVDNWFDRPESLIRDGYYSVMDTLETLKCHPQAAQMLEQIMAKARSSYGDVAKNIRMPESVQKMMDQTPLYKLLKQAGKAISADDVRQYNSLLNQVKRRRLRMDNTFLLGASTAAYQVEGNNIYSDFWTMEHLEHTSYAEKSGMAVDHYHRYEEDIAMMKAAGMNAYRFSIEWARIEQEKGVYHREETEHYRKVLECCHKNHITPVVTMHHFSSPKWLIAEGGWESEHVVEYFKNYCVYLVRELGDLMIYVCTINEANMRMQISAVMRTMLKNMGVNLQVGVKIELPEKVRVGQQEACAAFGGVDAVHTFQTPCSERGDQLIMEAHMAAREAMKAVCPHLKIGLTLSLHDIQAVDGGETLAHKAWDEEFLHYVSYIKNDDFFGLQNYTRTLMGADGELPVPEGHKRTQMNYEYYPQALEHVIRMVHESLDIPIIVTENGVAADDDHDRVAFIETALQGIKKCQADGIPVAGYLHWSLLDNFEWQLGYAKTFGLIAVDRRTQKRYPKESFYKMAEIWTQIK